MHLKISMIQQILSSKFYIGKTDGFYISAHSSLLRDFLLSYATIIIAINWTAHKYKFL